MKNEFVCVDLGASETRVVSKDGAVYTLPNNAAFVDSSENVDIATGGGNDPNEVFLGALDVTITKLSGTQCPHFPCRVIMGDMGNRYSTDCTVPSMLRNKADQAINFVSAVVASARQVMFDKVKGDIKLYIALPPIEVKYSKEIFGTLCGKYSVKFNRLSKEVTVNINQIVCVPESQMALTRFFFGTNGKKTENAEKYGSGYVMSLDIGASTTDLAFTKDMRPWENSRQTFKTGCNVIKANIANCIRGKYGFDPTPAQEEEVLETGRIRLGNKFDDMSADLRNAKAEFARSILTQIQSYFRLINIPLPMVRAIAVSGGGSMASEFTADDGTVIRTTGPVSEFITDELNKIVEGIDVVNVDGDPRKANIIGEFIQACFDEMVEQMQAAQAQKQAQTEE